jgi:uncharacterized protein (TIGR02266 family)
VGVEEKRRATRSGLLVEVTYEGAGARAQTRISDISDIGVFVETMSPQPVGAKVRLSFSLPGGRAVQADGIVKQVQAGIGMGIEFTTLKPEDAEYIRSFGTEGSGQ